MYKHAYTLYSAVRPFGCSVALGSYDEIDGPQLYMVDPSGVSFVCSLFPPIFVYDLKNIKIVHILGISWMCYGESKTGC
jgi:hypothetical protein